MMRTHVDSAESLDSGAEANPSVPIEPIRDRVFGLLTDLCATRPDISSESLRLLSHTLLGVAKDADSDALFDIGRALPWLTALIGVTEEERPVLEVAHRLVDHGHARALTAAAITHRLEAAYAAPARTSARPGFERSRPARLAAALREIAELDSELVDLLLRSDPQIRAHLGDDCRLLAAAVEICETTADSVVANRLRDLAPEWEDADRGVHSASLKVLCDLERSWDGGAVAQTHLSERARRFELSGTDHLRQSGFLPAVRVAIALGAGEFDPNQTPSLDTVKGFVGKPLAPLALALAQTRWAVLAVDEARADDFVAGSWLAFLEDGTPELAEHFEISKREATSFAQLCLHLLNFCDFVATDRTAANDGRRDRIMLIEDRLRDRAVSGYAAEHRLAVATRIDRYLGAADGSTSGLLDEVDPSGGARRDFEELLRESVVLGAGPWLAHLGHASVVRLFGASGALARDLPTVDVLSRWWLDLRPIRDAWQGRTESLRLLLESLDLQAQLMDAREPAHRVICADLPGAGIVAPAVSDNRELEVLLELLINHPDSADPLREPLHQRLVQITRPVPEFGGGFEGLMAFEAQCAWVRK